MAVLKLVICLLALPLLLFLPGYLLLQVLHSRENGRSGLGEKVFQSILVSTLLTSVLAFPLAESGILSIGLLLGLLGGIVLLLGAIVWRQRIWLAPPRPARPDLFPLLVALLSAVIAFHPYEYILGSGDAGSYVNIGVAIADNGGIILYNHDLAGLDPQVAQQELLFADIPMPGMRQMYHHFPSFLISNLGEGQITPQFYHLFPVWIALGYALFGLRGALSVTPMFGVLATLAVYFAGKTILGRWAGFLGSLLLSINMVQMWFSRYPTSEIITQYFLFASIYLLTLWLERRPTLAGARWTASLGVLVAMALTGVLLVRVDSLVALLPIGLWTLYLVLFRRQELRARWTFFLALGLALIHFLVYLRISGRYTVGSLLGLYYYLLRPGPMLALAGLGLGGFLTVALLSYKGWLKRHERSVRGLLIAVLAGLGIWAYFVWPAITPPQTVEYYAWPEPLRLTFENDENLVRLGWYVSPLGILLGFLGLLEVLRREPSRRCAYLLAIFLLYGAIYTYHVADAPHQIHIMRRFVPEVIPTLALGAGYALQRIGQVFRSKGGLVVASTLGLGLAMLTALPTWPLLGYVEYAGAIDQVTALASHFTEHDVLLYADVEYGTLLGMPLQYIFHRPGFVLQRERPDPTLLAKQVQAWEEQGKEVYLLVIDGRSRLSPTDFSLEFQGTVSFSLPLLERPLDRRPARIGEMPFFMEIYRLSTGTGAMTGGERFVDVGSADYLFIGHGFLGKERIPDGPTFRWTQGDAELVLPGNWFTGTGAISLTMVLGSTRPPEAPPAQLEVWIEDAALGSLTVQAPLRPYGIIVPEKVAMAVAGQKQVRLRLRCNTWQPSANGIPDERELGVLVDWVRVETADSQSWRALPR